MGYCMEEGLIYRHKDIQSSRFDKINECVTNRSVMGGILTTVVTNTNRPVD